MNKKIISVLLSGALLATTCMMSSARVSAVSNDEAVQSKAVTEALESNASDPVELVFYSYLMDGVSQPGHKQYVFQQKQVVKANRGDEIKLKINMKAEDDPYLSSLSIRYDLKESDDIEGLFGKNGLMETSQCNFVATHVPFRRTGLLEYQGIKMNDVIQAKCDKYYDDGDIFYDWGAFSEYSLSDKFDAFSIVPAEFISDDSEEFKQMKNDMKFSSAQGDEYCTITFKVSEDTSLGNQQTCVIYTPEFQAAMVQGTVVQVTEMKMDITGSTFEGGNQYVVGDCNTDGKITLADMILLQRSKVGMVKLSELGKKGADVDCDGSITLKDMLLLQRYLVNIKYNYAPINTTKTY